METRRCGVWSRVNMIQGFENLAFIPYHDFFFFDYGFRFLFFIIWLFAMLWLWSPLLR